MKSYIAKISFLGLYVLLTSINSTAQQKDSVANMRTFVQICNAYKQAPLYLNLQYTVTSNFITNPGDSSSTQGEFYITAKKSYIKFGELEQMVNDSMALLVSEKLQRMILYNNAAPVITQMKAMMGMQMPDSAIKNLCGKYQVSIRELSDKNESIRLENRNHLYNTSLPRETIELKYNKKTKLPIQITSIQRNLIAIEQADYDKLTKQKDFTGKLFKIEEDYYVVKEKTSGYVYKKIMHEASLKVPVSFEERVMKSSEGKYMPVKPYEHYILTEE